MPSQRCDLHLALLGGLVADVLDASAITFRVTRRVVGVDRERVKLKDIDVARTDGLTPGRSDLLLDCWLSDDSTRQKARVALTTAK